MHPSWIEIPGLGVLDWDSWIWIAGLGFLDWDSWIGAAGYQPLAYCEDNVRILHGYFNDLICILQIQYKDNIKIKE